MFPERKRGRYSRPTVFPQRPAAPSSRSSARPKTKALTPEKTPGTNRSTMPYSINSRFQIGGFRLEIWLPCVDVSTSLGEARPGHNDYNIHCMSGMGCPYRLHASLRMILAVTASTDRQPAAIPGLHRAIPARFQAGADGTIRPSAGQASFAAATLSRALPALDRLSPDDRAGARRPPQWRRS